MPGSSVHPDDTAPHRAGRSETENKPQVRPPQPFLSRTLLLISLDLEHRTASPTTSSPSSSKCGARCARPSAPCWRSGSSSSSSCCGSTRRRAWRCASLRTRDAAWSRRASLTRATLWSSTAESWSTWTRPSGGRRSTPVTRALGATCTISNTRTINTGKCLIYLRSCFGIKKSYMLYGNKNGMVAVLTQLQNRAVWAASSITRGTATCWHARSSSMAYRGSCSSPSSRYRLARKWRTTTATGQRNRSSTTRGWPSEPLRHPHPLVFSSSAALLH